VGDVMVYERPETPQSGHAHGSVYTKGTVLPCWASSGFPG
jgi:hypothetical protein